ncbi:MAG: SDR family oxidoreductase [Acidimicrobiales bacterium]|nr:SDR family oxidoreductase [Acidimicrobiales bacterium]
MISPTNVVLGAASGMGAATAALLAPRGRLLLADLDATKLSEVAAALGGDVDTIVCDVTRQVDVDALVEATGTLGALVVTAGLSPSMARGQMIYDVNLIGAERVVRAFESIVAAGSAAVVFASMAGHLVTADPDIDAILDEPDAADLFDRLDAAGLDSDEPGFAYALSKRGVVRLVQRHASAWGAKGGRILSLSPGIIDTGMGQLEASNEPAMATMVETSPLARMAAAEEVAKVAAFLVSEDASFMTATDVLVDGGCVAVTGGIR